MQLKSRPRAEARLRDNEAERLPNDFMLNEDDFYSSMGAVVRCLRARRHEVNEPSLDLIRAALFHLRSEERDRTLDDVARAALSAAPSDSSHKIWDGHLEVWNAAERFNGWLTGGRRK
jgi:hypothetical protein